MRLDDFNSNFNNKYGITEDIDLTDGTSQDGTYTCPNCEGIFYRNSDSNNCPFCGNPIDECITEGIFDKDSRAHRIERRMKKVDDPTKKYELQQKANKIGNSVSKNASLSQKLSARSKKAADDAGAKDTYESSIEHKIIPEFKGLLDQCETYEDKEDAFNSYLAEVRKKSRSRISPSHPLYKALWSAFKDSVNSIKYDSNGKQIFNKEDHKGEDRKEDDVRAQSPEKERAEEVVGNSENSVNDKDVVPETDNKSQGDGDPINGKKMDDEIAYLILSITQSGLKVSNELLTKIVNLASTDAKKDLMGMINK